MNQRKLIPLFILSILLFLAAACAPALIIEAEEAESAESDEHASEQSHDSEDEHHDDDMEMAHMHVNAPADFASLSNPFANDHEAIEAGAEIFQTSCATCHGPEGLGDGSAAETLDPKPATLADGTMMGDLSDGYLFWRVTKGGQMEPFNSAMPPWESTLTEQQRWQVISFVRTLAEDSDGHMHDTDDDHMDDNHVDDDHMDDNHVDDDHMDDNRMDDDHDGDSHMDDDHDGDNHVDDDRDGDNHMDDDHDGDNHEDESHKDDS